MQFSPAEKVIRKLRMHALYTPDMAEIAKKKRHLLFYFSPDGRQIADFTKTSDKDHPECLLYFGEGTTTSDTYVLKKPDVTRIGKGALAFRSDAITERKRICGHVFGLTPKQLHAMDIIEDNNIFKKREMISVIMEDQATRLASNNARRPHTRMWAYFAIPDQFEDWKTYSNCPIRKIRHEMAYF